MIPKSLPVDELLRLACVYAECDREEWLRAIAHCDDAEMNTERERVQAYLTQLRAYRTKRWGRTKLEEAMDGMVSVPVEEIAARLPELQEGEGDV
jgi:hypothetical protein